MIILILINQDYFHYDILVYITGFVCLSSVNSQVQKIADSVGVASEVQKRCLKRKSVGMYRQIRHEHNL